MKSIAIFIPTFNAASTLANVLDRIPGDIRNNVSEIFVIDDESVDGTYKIGVEYKRKNGMVNLQIYRNERNLGYGGNQKKAYQYAIEHGFDIVVMLHGDAQYPPELIPELIKPLEIDKADLVMGSRMLGDALGGGMPYWRYIGNRFLTWVMNVVLGLNMSEYHSGFRAFNVSALRKMPFMLLSDNYHFDAELYIQFALAKMRIFEIPIPTHYGEESHSPTVRQSFAYGTNILKEIFRLLMHRWGIVRQQKYDLHSYALTFEQV